MAPASVLSSAVGDGASPRQAGSMGRGTDVRWRRYVHSTGALPAPGRLADRPFTGGRRRRRPRPRRRVSAGVHCLPVTSATSARRRAGPERAAVGSQCSSHLTDGGREAAAAAVTVDGSWTDGGLCRIHSQVGESDWDGAQVKSVVSSLFWGGEFTWAWK